MSIIRLIAEHNQTRNLTICFTNFRNVTNKIFPYITDSACDILFIASSNNGLK